MNSQPLHLRFLAPAGHFNEALPVGNGRLGAMVFGQPHREKLVLNEDSCWAGGRRDRINPKSEGALAELRELLFSGRYPEAQALASERFLAVPSTIDSYQPMGELDFRIGWRSPVTDYRRWLDLDGAVAVCEWHEGEIHHRRTVFASAPDQVLVMQHDVLAGSPPPCSVRFEREGPVESNNVSNGDLLLLDHAHAEASRYGDRLDQTPSGRATPLALRLRAVIDTGEQKTLGQRLHISGARRITFLIAMGTGIRENDPASACLRVLDSAAAWSFAELLARHQEDHQTLFRRFQIDLGEPADDGRPLPERLAAFRTGAFDPGLLALVAQHRRYLLIAASRPGSLPSNLQGIWTEQLQGPWNCDYHFNINLQMNYWLAEPTGLGECVEPLIAWLESLVPQGERTAQALYGCRGWTLHHLSDAWGATEPFDGTWGFWPWGGAWLALHLHDHWRYSGDPLVLARVWPLVRGAVRFVLDFLLEAPTNSVHAGHLTTCPSHSPENAFLTADGQAVKFTHGVTMDFGLCRALFAASLKEIEALDSEGELHAEILAAGKRLPPLAISARTGGIQEWAEDHAEADPGHRHVSALFDLYPGVGISLTRSPELAVAAVRTLERKAAHQADSSYGQPGWTLNWIACFWARLGDGDAALGRLERLLTHCSTPNLFTFAHDQPQVADACGTTAAICEMLVQTHDGFVRLLPALPSAWPDGKVTGLRLPGAITLDLVWRAGRVHTARFFAERSATLRVLLPADLDSSPEGGVTVLALHAGEEIQFSRPAQS